MMRPPEQASTPAELKLLAKMDRMGKAAASWKNQKLTKGTTELEWSGGMLHPGGNPTKQMLATAPVMKLIRANEELLVNRRRAEFPVFFATEAKTNVQTFRSGDRWLGIVVNRDVNSKREVKLLLPPNVKSVKNIATGKNLLNDPENLPFAFPEKNVCFLHKEGFFETWQTVISQTSLSPEKQLRSFHEWFDGLKTLKFLHFLSDLRNFDIDKKQIKC
jgi:hypothetical protein